MGKHGGSSYQKYSRLEQRRARLKVLSYFLLAGLGLVTLSVVLTAFTR